MLLVKVNSRTVAKWRIKKTLHFEILNTKLRNYVLIVIFSSSSYFVNNARLSAKASSILKKKKKQQIKCVKN